MNVNTDWENILKCWVATDMTEIITRILGLRRTFVTQKWILLQTMKVKSAFPQVGVTTGEAEAFAYRLRDLIHLDLGA